MKRKAPNVVLFKTATNIRQGVLCRCIGGSIMWRFRLLGPAF